VRNFIRIGGYATYNEDGVMIDGSINASKSKHDQPKDQKYKWLMAGFLPLAIGQTHSLPNSQLTTTENGRHLSSGLLQKSRSDRAFPNIVFIIH
jgi:hypothetical protein